MLIGDGLALASAFFFAMANIAVAKAAREKAPDNAVLLSIVLTAALSALAFLLRPASMPHSGCSMLPTVAWFALSGILATVWGRQTMFKAVRFAGVIRATTIRRLTPFFSILLGAVLLGESVSGFAVLGAILIVASFALIYADNRRKFAAGELFPGANIPLGYTYGAISALVYAASYIARKRGLQSLPDPYFGALLGSVTALTYYLIGCLFSSRFRADVKALLSAPNAWQFFAALCISCGQISQFMALNYIGVGRLAVINSAELFLSTYLAVIVFGTESWPSVLVLLATALAAAGVILFAAG